MRHLIAAVLFICAATAVAQVNNPTTPTAYDATNAPKGVIFTHPIANVPFTTLGSTTAFTVPAGNTFVCTGAYAILTTVTGFSSSTTPQWRILSGAAGNPATSTAAPGAGWDVVGELSISAAVNSSTIYSPATAGTNVLVNVTSSVSASSALVATVYVSGFYY